MKKKILLGATVAAAIGLVVWYLLPQAAPRMDEGLDDDDLRPADFPVDFAGMEVKTAW